MTSLVEQSRALSEVNRSLIEETQARIAIGWRLHSGWFGIRGGADTTASSGGAPTPYLSLEELEHLVHDKIKRGALFILRDRTYQAGPVTGQPCIVCGQILSRGSEREVQGPRGNLFAHVVCHVIWHRESLALRREGVSRGGGE